MNTVDILKSINSSSVEDKISRMGDELLSNPGLLPELLSIANDGGQSYVIRGLASRYFTQVSLGAIERLSHSDCKVVRMGVDYGREVIDGSFMFLQDFILKHEPNKLIDAIKDNDTEVVGFILDNLGNPNLLPAINHAAHTGRYEAFLLVFDKWRLLNPDGSLPPITFRYMVLGGNVDILKCIPNFIELYPDCTEDGIESKNPEILAWLINNGVTLTTNSLVSAAKSNQIEMVKLVMDNVCFDDKTAREAVTGTSDMDIIKYIIGKTKIEPPEETVVLAAKLDDVQTLEFLFQHSGKDHRNAALFNSIFYASWKAVIFLLENGSFFQDQTGEIHKQLVMDELGVSSLPESGREIANMIKIKLVHQE